LPVLDEEFSARLAKQFRRPGKTYTINKLIFKDSFLR
jgi:hypothetical protein